MINSRESDAYDEKGCIRGDASGEIGPYTHVMIPYPGYALENGYAVKTKTFADEKVWGDEKQNRDDKTSGFQIFTSKKAKDERKEVAPMEKVTNFCNDDKEMRVVPNFCAICLAELELSDRITWSSNPDCTHVFHEDCIVQWLVSLGRTKSACLMFAANVDEKKLLNYELECPCCRQDFISKSETQLFGVNIVGEENV